jgi:FK506-binding nuclear protein
MCYLIELLLQCKSDSLGEDVGTDSEESSEYDSENGYDDHFFDDSDMEMYTSSPVRNSGGIVILSVFS